LRKSPSAQDLAALFSTPVGTLSVLDGRTNTIVGTVKIGDGFSPDGCFLDQSTCTSFGAESSSNAFSARTGKIYVPNLGINAVTVLSR